MLEEEFRSLCKQKSDATHKRIFDSPFDPSITIITYALISSRATSMPQGLPFFSKQTLVNAVDLLEKFRYVIDFAPVAID